VVLVMVVVPILWTIVIAFQDLRLGNLRSRLFDAAAVGGPGGGGHLRLADHAQPQARHHQRHRGRPP
jgi:ABC-type sugar transport system permease subunit